jgi:hypothetical protein
MMNFKKDVVYYFDEMIGTYHYAYAHPMKPLRVAMTDEIVHKYELDRHFDTIVTINSPRIWNSRRYITTTPLRTTSPPSTLTSTSISSAPSPRRIGTITRTSSIASTSRKIVRSWSVCTTTA